MNVIDLPERDLALREFGLIFPQALDLARDDQIFILAELHTVLSREPLRTFCDEVNVRALAQDLARSANGIAQMLDASDAAGAKRRSIHNKCVELDFAVAIQKAAASGVEGLVVFHDDDGFFNGVERRATTFKHTPSGAQGIVDPSDVGVDHVIRHGPGATMND